MLVRYEIALWNAVDGQLGASGRVSLARLQALRVVESFAGRCRVQDISDRLGITAGAVSKLVDRLEHDGLVTRTPNPGNRRSSLLQLTADGAEELAAAQAVGDRIMGIAVGDEDLEPLTTALQRLETHLSGAQIGVQA